METNPLVRDWLFGGTYHTKLKAETEKCEMRASENIYIKNARLRFEWKELDFKANIYVFLFATKGFIFKNYNFWIFYLKTVTFVLNMVTQNITLYVLAKIYF